jgi:hypothetical protein
METTRDAPVVNAPGAEGLGARLEKMLGEHAARRRTDLAREQKSKDDAAAFLAHFALLKRDVVRPVFETAAAVLSAHGFQCQIPEQTFVRDDHGKVTEAGISLRLVPAGAPGGANAGAHAGEHAHTLSITTRHYNKAVWFNAGVAMNAGGLAGSKGAYPPERVTRELVEEAVEKFIGGVIGA